MRISSLTFAFLLIGSGGATAQGVPLPWGQHSDQVAWEVFVQAVAPSGVPNGKNVEFETWASDQDLYQNSPHWPNPNAPKQLHQSLQRTMLERTMRRGKLKPKLVPDTCSSDLGNIAVAQFPADACIGEEVRRNWASFQYIVANNLYSTSGLAAAYKKNLDVELPADSVDVKANWVRVPDLLRWLSNVKVTHPVTAEEVRQVYYTNTVVEGGASVEYAMVAMHITSKQIKNWVWMTFDHELNPGRCDDTGCHDSFGAATADTMPLNQGGKPANEEYGQCAKSVALEAMMASATLDSVWRHYCLKGSQITFVDSDNKPVLLGNSVTERIIPGIPILRSSCISCHRLAAFDATGKANDFSAVIGVPDPAKLKDKLVNDFIWGIGNIQAPQAAVQSQPH